MATRHTKPTVIELFAGAGGLALGTELAGFEHSLLVEYNHDACETLRMNRPHWHVVEADIHSVSFEEYRDSVDLVTGGAPCQPFSYAGKRLGLGDTRGTLFAEYARCLEETHPKAFIFENVRGMLRHDSDRTFKTILAAFKTCGYRTAYQVLNANDYNVPQHRERLIVVGLRDDLPDIPFEFPTTIDPKPVLADALRGVPASIGAVYPEKKAKLFEMIPPGGYWKNLPPQLAEEYMGARQYHAHDRGGSTGMLRRLSFDEPSLAILTSPSQKRTERCHPTETRPLTVRESARIQTFPDDWVFYGSMSSQYKQIGNAVPVNLAKAVASSVLSWLSDNTG